MSRTKTDMMTNGTDDPDINPLQLQAIWFLTKAPKMYNGEKTASSINVAGKT
jgi:hypothetical protein